MNFSVNTCCNLQSFNVSTQARGKVIAKAEILSFVKQETIIEVAESIL